MAGPSRPRAVVAVGASAGGVEALSSLVSSLPAGFPAAVLVVLHIPASGYSALPSILSRAGRLPVRHATDGAALEEGVILVAPPDHHLAVEGAHVTVRRSPKENGHRPSVDVLLRSAGDVYESRAAGVVMSGFLDDGAAGLAQLKRAGGFTAVQAASDAAFPDMPLAAMATTAVDVVAPAAEIHSHLEKWLADLAERPPGRQHEPPSGGERISQFTCPDCGGTLWETEGGPPRYHCRVGHRYSASSLFAGKQQALESALWAAVVALEERRDLSQRIVKRLEQGGRDRLVRRYEAEISEAERNLELLHRVFDNLIHTHVLDAATQGTPADE